MHNGHHDSTTRFTCWRHPPGLIPGQSVTLRHVELHSDDVASVTFVDGEGKVEQALIYRDQEPQLELVRKAAR